MADVWSDLPAGHQWTLFEYDRLHHYCGLGREWLASDRRKETIREFDLGVGPGQIPPGVARVLDWCDTQDAYSKGESSTTTAVRALLAGLFTERQP